MKQLPSRIIGLAAYRIAQVIVWLLAHVLWRIDLEGTENIPKNGPFILAPNHRSNVDGALTCILSRRPMRYLAKSEMFKVESVGKLYKAMGAIPVNRGAPDRSSLQACIKALGEGRGLVLFPEGTRQTGHEIAELHDGAAYLALRTGAPLVPVGFGNTAHAHQKGKWYLSPVKVKCIVGDPLVFDRGGSKRVERVALDEATIKIRARLQELFDLSEGRRIGPPSAP